MFRLGLFESYFRTSSRDRDQCSADRKGTVFGSVLEIRDRLRQDHPLRAVSLVCQDRLHRKAFEMLSLGTEVGLFGTCDCRQEGADKYYQAKLLHF